MITKEQFLKSYNKYPPNGWTKFVFRYFSRDTVAKDMYLRRILVGILMTMFIIGFVATAVTNGEARKIIGTPTLIYTAVLVLLVPSCLIGVWMNNWRIRKIRLELGITIDEYNRYADMYVV